MEQCSVEQQVKLPIYRNIFHNDFNLGFLKPKKDRCDLCERYNMAVKSETMTEDLCAEFEEHNLKKKGARATREFDRKRKEANVLVLSFDLENVITVPKADISSFFYRKKLNVYNMTACVDRTKQGYCAIWNEGRSGRGGNDMASAVTKILDDYPETTEIITWSDSCVPQNRNQIMSFAIGEFLQRHPQIKQITMKFSEKNHSCIQEVDNVHSSIEKSMRVAEFYSPVSFIKVLKQVKRNNPLTIIQMKNSDFKDFHAVSKILKKYGEVPYTKVVALRFISGKPQVEYKTSFFSGAAEIPFHTVVISGEKMSTRVSSGHPIPFLFQLPKLCCKAKPLMDKFQDFKAMLHLMPSVDKEFFEKCILCNKS